MTDSVARVTNGRVLEGAGRLDAAAEVRDVRCAGGAGARSRIGVWARQGEAVCEAHALVTVTDRGCCRRRRERRARTRSARLHAGARARPALGGRASIADQNLIVVNSGHRDYVFAARAKSGSKLRYLVRLYAKEMVRRNFPGLRGEELLDRLIELSLYTEEHLR